MVRFFSFFLFTPQSLKQEAQLAISDFKTMQDEIAELKVTNADLQSKLDAAVKEKADKVCLDIYMFEVLAGVFFLLRPSALLFD